MTRFSITVDGLTEVTGNLARLPEDFRAVVAETIDEGSAIIESETRARVPVDKGTMKLSLGRNVRSDGLQASVGFGDVKARFVEFATVDTPAQPSLWPAFRRGARYIRRQMRDWAARAGQRVRFKTKRFRPRPTGVTL